MHDPDSLPPRFWHRLPGGALRCNVCPRACRLKLDEIGFCERRANRDQVLAATPPVHPVGFCINPIESLALHHYLPGVAALCFCTGDAASPCACERPIRSRASAAPEPALPLPSPRTLAGAAARTDCRVVAFTHDPALFPEYAIAVADACHEAGIGVAASSAGYMHAAPRAELLQRLDAISFDLLGFEQEPYRNCGARLSDVLETLDYLRTLPTLWLELEVKMRPGQNDDERRLNWLTKWIVENLGPEVPIQFSHAAGNGGGGLREPYRLLSRARDIALGNGMHYVYSDHLSGGRVRTTLCPGCRKAVISREALAIVEWKLDAVGACGDCGATIAGVFESGHGRWSPRHFRVDPVALARAPG